jgi:hypothetical protein
VADRPTALELIEAVSEFLSTEVVPAVSDHRLRFRTLVAMNALGIALRELQVGGDAVLPDEEAAAMARRIRAGDVREEDHTFLKEHVAAKLRVSNPAYLERYE